MKLKNKWIQCHLKYGIRRIQATNGVPIISCFLRHKFIHCLMLPSKKKCTSSYTPILIESEQVIRGGSRAGLWGGHNSLFHVKSFLTPLLGIGNIAVSGAMPPALSGSTPVSE